MSEVPPEQRKAMENAPFYRLLGFRLTDLSPGYARMAVTLRPDHANFQGGVDGALITSLADCASACACSTLARSVGLQADVHFLSAPSPTGELVAEARTVHAGRTISLTEVTVKDGAGKVVAKFTGTAFSRPS